MAPHNGRASDAVQVLKLFPAWLKQHLVAALLTIAGVVGAIQSIIKIFGLPQEFLLPTLVGFLFLGAVLFCAWLISDPKQAVSPNAGNIGDASTGSGPKKEPSSLFSPRVRFFAKLALPANVILGTLSVYVVTPTIIRPILAVQKLISNVDSARQNLQNDSRAMTLYSLYSDARVAQGEGFWDHVTSAMTVHVGNVSDHNQQLQTPIRGHLVPEELTKHSESERSPIDFKWVKDDKLASELTLLVGHFLKADQESDKIESLKHGNLSDYDNAKVFNQDICRYWELVLGQRKTILTDMNPDDLRTAEQNVRAWLKRKE